MTDTYTREELDTAGEAALAEALRDRDSYQARLEEAVTSNVTLGTALAEAREQNERLKERIASLEKENAARMAEINRLREALKFLLCHSWRVVHIGHNLNRLIVDVSDEKKAELFAALNPKDNALTELQRLGQEFDDG